MNEAKIAQMQEARDNLTTALGVTGDKILFVLVNLRKGFEAAGDKESAAKIDLLRILIVELIDVQLNTMGITIPVSKH